MRINYNRGFGLAEILVGLVIGLLILLAGTSVIINYNQTQKASIGSNTATGQGMSSVEVLSRSLRQAGYGFVNQFSYTKPGSPTSGIACTTLGGLAFTPLGITSSATTDSIAVAYGESSAGISSPELNMQTPVYSLGTLTFSNTDQLVVNGKIIVADSAGDCLIASVTAKTATTATLASVGTGGSTLTGVITQVYPIQVMHNELWSVDTTKHQLKYVDTINGTQIVASNVVALKAQFGMVDTNGNFSAYGITGANAGNSHAIRIALIIKDTDRQKGDASKCTDSTGTIRTVANGSNLVNIDNWNADGTTAQLTVDVSGITDWQCYSFKVVTQTIPVRNYLWGI